MFSLKKKTNIAYARNNKYLMLNTAKLKFQIKLHPHFHDCNVTLRGRLQICYYVPAYYHTVIVNNT